MAGIELQAAVPRPKLRWYQFSLRGLLFFTLFVAILLSILAVGRTGRVYKVVLYVERRLPIVIHYSLPTHGEIYFWDVEKDVGIELATSDSVLEATAQSLRRQGVEKVDNENDSAQILQRHVAVENASKEYPYFTFTVFSRDPDLTRKVASTYYETWLAMIPILAPAVKQRYVDRAKLELPGADFQKFESEWRTAEKWGALASLAPTSARSMPWRPFTIRDGERPENWSLARPIYPRWNLCFLIAILWFEIGTAIFVDSRWCRYRANRAVVESP